MNRLVLAALGGLVAAPLLIAACGGDSKSTDGGSRIDASIGPDATPAPYCTARAGTNLKLTKIVDGLDLPVFVTAPVRDPRLFVLEQAGRIRVVVDGVLQPTPFLDLEGMSLPAADRINNVGDERGLLGLAFHPDYARNGRFFIHYTANNGDNASTVVVAEYTAEPTSNVVTTSGKILLRIPHPRDNHNGGTLHFGGDGFLYISVGDGGGGNHSEDGGPDTQNNMSRLGMILRIDVDQGDPYGIPPTNPWAVSGGTKEMFAWGLRNPWRFFIDPATSDIVIGDVGQGRFEEVNVIPGGMPGLNFGWPYCEGDRQLVEASDPQDGPPIQPPACDNSEHGTTAPVVAYDQRTPDNPCSVVAGPVYRGTCIPDLVGHAFFGDFCTGKIESFVHRAGQRPTVVDRSDDLDSTDLLVQTFSSFGVDGFGEIYVTMLGNRAPPRDSGTVYRIEVQ